MLSNFSQNSRKRTKNGIISFNLLSNAQTNLQRANASVCSDAGSRPNFYLSTMVMKIDAAMKGDRSEKEPTYKF